MTTIQLIHRRPTLSETAIGVSFVTHTPFGHTPLQRIVMVPNSEILLDDHVSRSMVVSAVKARLLDPTEEVRFADEEVGV